MTRENLGSILLNMGAIDELQLRAALAHQRKWGSPLGRIVVDHHFCRSQDVLSALCEQMGLEGVALDTEPIDPSVRVLIPLKVAEQCRAVPLRLEGKRQEQIVVAFAAPAPLSAIDAVRTVSGRRVIPVLADDEAIDRAQRRIYGGIESNEFVERVVVPLNEQTFDAPEDDRPVLLFGWTAPGASALRTMLRQCGLEARVASPSEVLGCREDDVILSSVGAMSALSTVRLPTRGRLVVITDQPERDLALATELGARGLVPAPMDSDLLARSVRRCRELDLPQHAA